MIVFNLYPRRDAGLCKGAFEATGAGARKHWDFAAVER